MKLKWKLAGITAVVSAITLVASPIASAHHPVIVAGLDCGGTVSYTVTADELNATRDNPNVAVTDTSGIAQPAAAGVFNGTNNWSFSGSYTIPTNVIVDTLTAQALSPWGDGYFNPSNDSSVTVTRPTDCTSIATSLSSSTITAGGSAYDSATLSGATSNAGGTVTYTLYVDSSCSTPSTSPALDQTVNVRDGSVPSSSTVNFPNAGIYYWQAAYSGDPSNNAGTSTCTSEVLMVNAPPPPPTPAPPPAPTPAPPPAPTPAPPPTPTPSTPSIPAIAIIKSPATQTIPSGGKATFTIVVTNSGDVVLSNVVVSDDQTPACAATSSTIAGLASMAPGASVTYVCGLANVTASFTNFATDTGTPPSGSDVSATDSALVIVSPLFTPPSVVVSHASVAHPSISIAKDPESQTIANGGTARFTITVKNTGDVTLTNVTVGDPLSSGCDNSLGTLAASKTRSYSCARSDVTGDFINIAVVNGRPPTGPEVSNSASAAVTAPPFKPPATKRPPVARAKGGATSASKVVSKPKKAQAKPKNARAKSKPLVVSHVVPKTTG